MEMPEQDSVGGVHERRSEIVDVMMFCCLVLNIDILWSLPRAAYENGGGFFLALFIAANILFIFPIIHLEVFVGQRHQSGICRIYRSYGRAFEGFGAAVLILAFLASLRDIEASFMVIRHIRNLIVDITDILSCGSERYKGALCTSLYSDEQCRVLNGPLHFYQYGECSDEYYIGKLPPFTKYYFEDLLRDLGETHINHLLYYFIVFAIYACISIAGERITRILLAIIYAAFLTCFLISVAKFLSMTSLSVLVELFWIITTPEPLFSFRAYHEAIHLAVKCSGVMIYGIMSSASFRSKSGNTYGLALAILLNNIFIAVLSFVFTLSTSAYLVARGYNGYNYSPRESEHEYFLGTMADAHFTNSGDYKWIIITTIPIIIARLVHFFAAIIIIYGILRDRKNHRSSTSIFGTSTICIGGFFVMAVANYYKNNFLSAGIISEEDSKIILIVGTVNAFLHLYGNREYLVDLNELYPEDDNRLKLFKPTSSIYFVLYKIIPFVFTFIAISGTQDFQLNTKKDVILILTPYIVILVYFFHNLSTLRKRNELSMLFSITPEHPSYNRINLIEQFGIEEHQISAALSAEKRTPKERNLEKRGAEKGGAEKSSSAERKSANTGRTDTGSAEKGSAKAGGTSIGSVVKGSAEVEKVRGRKDSTQTREGTSSKQKFVKSKQSVQIEGKRAPMERRWKSKDRRKSRSEQPETNDNTARKNSSVTHGAAKRSAHTGRSDSNSRPEGPE